MAAAKTCMKAEAVRARATFVKKEAEVLVAKAKLEAELHSLQHEKEFAAAAAEAEILESVAADLDFEGSRSFDVTAIPHESIEKWTSDYIDHLSATQYSQLSPLKLSHTPLPTGQHMANSLFKAKQTIRTLPLREVHQPCTADCTGMSDITRYLVPGRA